MTPSPPVTSVSFSQATHGPCLAEESTTGVKQRRPVAYGSPEFCGIFVDIVLLDCCPCYMKYQEVTMIVFSEKPMKKFKLILLSAALAMSGIITLLMIMQVEVWAAAPAVCHWTGAQDGVARVVGTGGHVRPGQLLNCV